MALEGQEDGKVQVGRVNEALHPVLAHSLPETEVPGTVRRKVAPGARRQEGLARVGIGSDRAAM